MSSHQESCLIVEDNPEFNRILSRSLKKQYRVDQVTSLAGAFQHVAENESGYDLIVLDRTLPDGDGLELLTLLQQDFPRTRVCVVSALSLEADKMLGLKQGADAYLSKPLSTRYIIEQVRALLRIGNTAHKDVQQWKDIFFDPATNFVRRNTREVRLTRREAQCLGVFFSSQEGKVTRQDLLRIFWEPDRVEYSGVLQVNVQRLRQKLKQLGVTIQAHYGAGYQLTPVQL